ncbi:MAG: hypothetical protein GVY19_09730 [Bacteroidetes bacterium]|jgi:sulfite reductase alpha subunit-like flavoprotein/uncharacterized iron-regulated membrane protein|nr:hypothetical protein [Bacteroidota bacterium]
MKSLPKRAYNILFHTHTVAGITTSVALFVIFFTGSISFFRHHMFQWEQPENRIEYAENIDLDRVLQTIAENNPNYIPDEDLNIWNGNSLVPVIRFTGHEHPKGDTSREDYFRGIIIPSDNYRYIPNTEPKYTLIDTLYRLHYLRQFPFGRYIAGFAGLFLLFASITGVLIHWQHVVGKLYAFVTKGEWRKIWSNAHTTLGLIGLPFQLVYGFTGALLGLLTFILLPSALLLFDGDTDKVIATVQPEMGIHPPEDSTKLQNKSVQAYFLKAQELFNNREITQIKLQRYGRNDGMITLNVDDGRNINGSGYVMYALKDGRELFRMEPNNKSYASSVLNALIKLHYGAFGGFFIKFTYFFLGLITCFMLISGIMLWYEARINNSKYTRRQRKFQYRSTKVFLSICMALLPATAILFIANKLVPIDTSSRISVVNSIFFISWLVLTIVGLFHKNFRHINIKYLTLLGILGLFVPLSNGLTTGDWFWSTWVERQWAIVSVDIAWILTSLLSFFSVYFIIKTNKNLPFNRQTGNTVTDRATTTKLLNTAINKDAEVIILYATSTGNSKNIAEQAQAYYNKQNVKATCKSTLHISVEDISTATNLLAIVSTDGEGDPPPMAYRFFDELFAKHMPRLEQLNFSVCALGDSDYDNFCLTGKELDRRLLELGATAFYPRIDCDIDYSASAMKWIKETCALFTQGNGMDTPGMQLTPEKVYQGIITERRELTNGKEVLPVFHLELNVNNADITYTIGDSIEIFPKNPEWLAEKINSCLEYDNLANKDVFKQKLQEEFEITTLKTQTIEKFYKLTENNLLKELLENPQELYELIEKGNVLDLIIRYKLQINAGALEQLLPPLKGREYSIASSPTMHPNALHLTIKTIRYDYLDNKHEGTASVYANETLQIGTKLDFKLSTNELFSLPKNANTPIIMIGVSTGIAPFRAILQERKVFKQPKNTWLIIGNRYKAQDNLYADEFEDFIKDEILERCDKVFSRDDNALKYVYEVIEENKGEMKVWLSKGAHVYLCGSIKMAKSVKQYWEQSFAKTKHSMLNLIQEERWHEDIY